MALPMCDQPIARPALVLVSDDRCYPLRATRLPAKVYWFRRALAAAVLLAVLWASSLLAAELHWSLSPESPVSYSQPEREYVVVGDTALRIESDDR